ncbi:hypothetical protein R5W24_005694 [Gemmata sp. JC717]|uniref:hypothetical protein n=1 Tax=Gemmata algarum TaxID=2975278 RepID=UPI0021BA8D00|nr:hypothetical protein [Gemmata algarum]MDY3556528.1 hypothetical protein [Gemmata algarum]
MRLTTPADSGRIAHPVMAVQVSCLVGYRWQGRAVRRPPRGLSMPGLAIGILSICAAVVPAKLPSDVFESTTRWFLLPVALDPALKGKAETIRIFVSSDRGKTWKHEQDCKATIGKVTIGVADDGLYWFAAQVVLKGGSRTPSELTDLIPGQKVFVNTTGRRVDIQKSYSNLLRENQELSNRVEELQKQLRDAESRRKPK